MLHSREDIVRKMLAAIEGGYIREAGAYLDDKFVYVDPAVQELEKDQFLTLCQELVNAFPDWKYHVREIRAQGNEVIARYHVTGTNRNLLHVPTLGVHAPPTDKHITLPEETAIFSFNGEKISMMQGDRRPDRGITGIFVQLDIKIPVMVSV